MYNTKTAVTSNEEFNSSYMNAGINENVFLTEVNIKKSPQNKDYIEFLFSDAEGRTVTMTEWKNEKNMWIKTDEDLQRRDNVQFGRILQILHCYMDEIPEKELNSFSEMINWVKITLDNIAERDKKPVRLKVIYDKNNYSVVSKNGIFVESMNVAETQIKKFARDNFERQATPDVETNTDPLTNSIGTPANGNDDLPF